MSKKLEPLVSVVIPSYNRALYIGEAIESVLAQTYHNIEVIVVDDGSTDNTEEVIQPYLSRIMYLQQENAERGASRNSGMRKATGEYLAFLDSDDIWLPSKVEADIKVLTQHPAVGLVYSDIIQIDECGRQIGMLRRKPRNGRVTKFLMSENFVSIGAHLGRRELFENVGGFVEDRRLSGSEDWEMWIRLSTATDFMHVPMATSKIRVHKANTMANTEGMNKSMNYALELLRSAEYLSDLEKQSLRKARSSVNLINAINFCTDGQLAKSKGCLLQALAADLGVLLDRRFAYTIYRLAKFHLAKKHTS